MVASERLPPPRGSLPLKSRLSPNSLNLWTVKEKKNPALKQTAAQTVVLLAKKKTGTERHYLTRLLPSYSVVLIVECLFFPCYLHSLMSHGLVEKYDFIKRERLSQSHSSQHARLSHNIQVA